MDKVIAGTRFWVSERGHYNILYPHIERQYSSRIDLPIKQELPLVNRLGLRAVEIESSTAMEMRLPIPVIWLDE